MPHPVWIVLVDFNGIDDTRACLASLAGQEAATVVVDNASAIDVRSALAAAFPWAQFVRSPANGGWAGGNNLGLKHALAGGAELVILLNNDTTVTPDFVAKLTAAAAAFPDYGILGPVIRFMAPPHEVQTEGVVFNRPDRDGFFQRVSVPLDGTVKIVDVDIVNGCCLMVRRNVVEQIGFVDERFFLIHEESDFCLRTQRAGFELGVVPADIVRHKGSSTFLREGKGNQRYYDARNLLRLLAKHRHRPGSRSTRSSFIHAFRYALSRYAIERENGFREPADAVLEGLYDALTGVSGPRPARWRPLFGAMRRLVALAWRVKSRCQASVRV